MKMLDVVKLTRALPALLGAKLPVSTSLKLLRIKDAVQKEANLYNEMVEGIEDSDALNELLETESELVIEEKVPLSELGAIEISAFDLEMLREVVDVE